MIKDYIYTATKEIISKKNFLLMRDKTGRREFTEKRSIFIRNIGNDFIILKLYNLDLYSFEELCDEMKVNRMEFEKIFSKPVEYKIFKVYISENKISPEMEQLLKNSHIHEVSKRKFIKPIYVDLSERKIECYYDGKFPNEGILDALSSTLNLKEEWEVFDEENILNLEREKEQDFKIKLNSRKSTGTYTLIILNTIIYAVAIHRAIIFNMDYFDVMHDFGIKDNELILKGEYTRLFAPIFLHGGLLHLVVNCYSLFSIGPICEKIFGNLKFLVIYLMSGIIGCLASFAFSNYWSLGASGAIFGILGAMLYFGTQKPVAFKTMFGNSLVSVVILNLLLGLSIQGIDNFGHVGGFIGGFLVAGILRYDKNDRWYIRIVSLIILAIMFWSMIVYGFNK